MAADESTNQDLGILEFCNNFDERKTLVETAERPVDVNISYQVAANQINFTITSSLPVIYQFEFKSINYTKMSNPYDVYSKTCTLTIDLEENQDGGGDDSNISGEIWCYSGQQTSSFAVDIDLTNGETQTIEDTISLNRGPVDFENNPPVVGDIVSLVKNRVGRCVFVGYLDGKKDLYYGIDLIHGEGKNDGSVKGKRYFQASSPTNGTFVKESSIAGMGICAGDAHLKPRMSGVAPREMHGLMVEETWSNPIEVVTCEEENRPGYNAMPSHEYLDDPHTMLAKVQLLKSLIEQSENCIAYTGAGISTSAGIDDYASKASGKESKIHEGRKKPKRAKHALPTLGHRVLTQLYRTEKLKHWVQQNHDGLPQKAGFPQKSINEIHGAWWDVSNPVVPMSGSLRHDLSEWMHEWQNNADLCLAMGTSLCGMSADRCVEKPAKNYIKGRGLGSIIVGLQRTPYDKMCSIRFYGTIDEVVSLLAREMNLIIPPYKTYEPDIPPEAIIEKDVYRVPYDDQGELTDDPDEMIVWDVRQLQRITVNAGPGKGFKGQITGYFPGSQHLECTTPRQYQGHADFGKKPYKYFCGVWWIECITKGQFPTMPFLNQKIRYQRDL